MDPATTVFDGWIPDRPDARDHTVDHPAVAACVAIAHDPATIPGQIDLSSDFPPVRHQGNLPSCTAFATSGLLEYVAWKSPRLDDVYASGRWG